MTKAIGLYLVWTGLGYMLISALIEIGFYLLNGGF